MRHRLILVAVTVAIAASSLGMAGAAHGGDDFVTSGSIVSSSPFGRFTPCSNAAVLASIQGITQFIVDIPVDTWGHDFSLTSDTGIGVFHAYLYAKSGTTCTKLNEAGSETGTVGEGTTHGVIVLFSPLIGPQEGFTLTVDR